MAKKIEVQTPVECVVAAFGTAKALADGLDIQRSTVTHWKTRNAGLIPAAYQAKNFAAG